jgi:porphobilinogen deaminase
MIPMAAWARDLPCTGMMHNLLALDAAVFDPDGRAQIRVSLTGPTDAPDTLGRSVAQALRNRGAEPLLRRTHPSDP